MMDNKASLQNDQAEKYFQDGEHAKALSAFQQIFLNYAKAADPYLRAEVARALHGAARCYISMNKQDIATQIHETLFKRYGQDDNPRTRYWVELARGANPPPLSDQDNTVQQDMEDNWEKFLNDNGLNDEAPAEDWPDFHLTNINSEEKNARPQLIVEEDISIARLKQVFDNAFIECHEEGSILRVQLDNTKFFLSLHEPHHFLTITGYFATRKYADRNEKIELVNTLNRDLVLVRFYLDGDEDLVTDCTLSYDQGILPYHIVNILRLMQDIIHTGIQKYDNNDLLR
jgi:hypothetical protein